MHIRVDAAMLRKIDRLVRKMRKEEEVPASRSRVVRGLLRSALEDEVRVSAVRDSIEEISQVSNRVVKRGLDEFRDVVSDYIQEELTGS